MSLSAVWGHSQHEHSQRAFSLRRELLIDDVRSVGKPANTLALSPQGNDPTAKSTCILECVVVRVTDYGGVTVVGVPIGTDQYVLEPTLEVVKDGRTDRLGNCLADMLDRQAGGLIAIGPLWQRTSHFKEL